MRIAILSLNPRHNYGGILQSYALKKVLEGMGHDVRVICKERHVPEFGLQQVIRWPYRLLRKLIGRDDTKIFAEHYYNKQNDRKYQNTDKFVDKYLNPRFVRSLREIKEREFEAFVVGSDQVWRPKFFKGTYSIGIENAFLDFAKEWNIKRIAYATSFGVSEWEYTNEETSACAELLKSFDAISVREISGVFFCKEYFDIGAIQSCDPSLLLSKEEYMALVPQKQHNSHSNLLVYCLDKNQELDDLVKSISVEKGLEPLYIINSLDRESVLPSVESWLQVFMDAEFVVTDSFHGCIFSIIFNKPFVCLVNEFRGGERFYTLIKNFSLDRQIIKSIDQYVPGSDYGAEIESRMRIKEKIEESYNYLVKALCVR